MKCVECGSRTHGDCSAPHSHGIPPIDERWELLADTVHALMRGYQISLTAALKDHVAPAVGRHPRSVERWWSEARHIPASVTPALVTLRGKARKRLANVKQYEKVAPRIPRATRPQDRPAQRARTAQDHPTTTE